MNEIDPTGEVAAWWATSVSHMEPGVIELRGRPVQDLIGTTSLASMIWLMQIATIMGKLTCQVDRSRLGRPLSPLGPNFSNIS